MAVRMVDQVVGDLTLVEHLLVVTPDALHFFSSRGEHRRSVTRTEMVLAGESGAFRDAAYTAPFLLILTQQSCILFPNN